MCERFLIEVKGKDGKCRLFNKNALSGVFINSNHYSIHSGDFKVWIDQKEYDRIKDLFAVQDIQPAIRHQRERRMIDTE